LQALNLTVAAEKRCNKDLLPETRGVFSPTGEPIKAIASLFRKKITTFSSFYKRKGKQSRKK